MVILGLVLGGALGFLFFCGVLLRWNDVKYRSEGLPPGTMGWPVFGETTEFLKHGPSFMKNQRASRLHGSRGEQVHPHERRKGPRSGYPQSMLDILGRWNIAAVHGALHKSMRGVLLSLIGPTAIREELLPKLDYFMRSHLCGWSGQTVDIQERTREIAFLTSLKLIAGIEAGKIADKLKEEFSMVVLGTLSLPIDLPGTNYRRAFQSRKKIVSMLRELVRERRRSSSTESRDMLSSLLQTEPKTGRELTDDQMIDLLITIIYSGYETVSTTSMMVLKYLHDHPRALQEVREEHLAIRRRKSTGEAIDWEDYKSMNVTRAVIYETMRLATIVNGVLRKTTEDLQIKGFTIPRGWKIYVYTRETNYDPFQYTEPLRFNPWRWQDKSLESHHYFTLFGGGSRLCPGKELGVVKISIFLHYFLTSYRWEEVGGEEILQFPRVEAAKGLHIRLRDY
ncbi:unnamed protein product [Spirodela intermedia]|uniref:Uncharacterized protein n=1 Tax=Spirodela intermedia TaxID=51605 RepID=A0A7I8IHT1_SPIIN|nr:unnamed protein product [Spirodela intermedia]CAA6657344.1 unnamed protein product [Spirodela intermedia]